jgi:hypothetical protein
VNCLRQVAKPERRTLAGRFKDRSQDSEIGAFGGFQVGDRVAGDSDQKFRWDELPNYLRGDGVGGEMNSVCQACQSHIEAVINQNTGLVGIRKP